MESDSWNGDGAGLRLPRPFFDGLTTYSGRCSCSRRNNSRNRRHNPRSSAGRRSRNSGHWCNPSRRSRCRCRSRCRRCHRRSSSGTPLPPRDRNPPGSCRSLPPDRRHRWGTVGVSHNVIEASWQAIVDSFEYKLYKDAKRGRKRHSGPRNQTAKKAARALARGAL